MPAHRIDNFAVGILLIASTRGVAILPTYVEPLLPWSVISRPLVGEPPTIDLAIGYRADNPAPVLRVLLAGVDHLKAAGHPGVANQTGASGLLETGPLAISWTATFTHRLFIHRPLLFASIPNAGANECFGNAPGRIDMRFALHVCATAAALMAALPSVQAMPLAPAGVGFEQGITLVRDGCGPFGHRSHYGYCKQDGDGGYGYDRGGYGGGYRRGPGFYEGGGFRERHCFIRETYEGPVRVCR